MRAGRWVGRVAAGVLVVGTLGVVGPSPAGAVTVTTDAEWTAAWADPAVAEIVLADDVEVPCVPEGARGRFGAVPLVVDGDGHALTDGCATTSTGGSWLTGSPTTWRDVGMVGAPDGFAAILLGGEVHLDGASVVVRNDGHGVRIGGVGASTVVDTTVELAEGPGPGLVVDTPTTIDRLRASGTGTGVEVTSAAGSSGATIRDSSILVAEIAVIASAPTVIERSTLRGGNAAVYANGDAPLAVRDSTLALPSGAHPLAAAVAANGPGRDISLDQATVVAPAGSRSVEVNGPSRVVLHATVLAGGRCTTENGGTFVSEGDNVATDASCATDGTGDRVLADAGLGPYDVDRGVARPDADGPLIDAVATCGSDADQLGQTRPAGPACDIGAIERQLPTGPTGVPGTSTPTSTPGGTAAPATPVAATARFTG